jgi:hypothetical protein
MQANTYLPYGQRGAGTCETPKEIIALFRCLIWKNSVTPMLQRKRIRSVAAPASISTARRAE